MTKRDAYNKGCEDMRERVAQELMKKGVDFALVKVVLTTNRPKAPLEVAEASWHAKESSVL